MQRLDVIRTGLGSSKSPFKFRSAQGKRLALKELAHARSVYVPASYTQVRIASRPQKLLAKARDGGGKEQRFYSKEWSRKRKLEKYKRLARLGEALPRIDRAISQLERLPLERRDAALALGLSRLCGMRPGSKVSERESGHYGATTLQRDQVRFRGARLAILDFPGKKGVQNVCEVQNPKWVKALKSAKQRATSEKRSNLLNTSTASVNRFLKEFGDFSAKDLRTWNANEAFARAALSEGSTPKEAIAKAAAKLNNTPAVVKSSYIDSRLVELFQNEPKRFRRQFSGNLRNALVRFWKK